MDVRHDSICLDVSGRSTVLLIKNYSEHRICNSLVYMGTIIHKALEVTVEKLTDSATVTRIHSDSGHALQQLATGPALQNDRFGCKIWEKFVDISQRNMENVVHLIWVPCRTCKVEGISGQIGRQKREVYETTQRKILT